MQTNISLLSDEGGDGCSLNVCRIACDLHEVSLHELRQLPQTDQHGATHTYEKDGVTLYFKVEDDNAILVAYYDNAMAA